MVGSVELEEDSAVALVAAGVLLSVPVAASAVVLEVVEGLRVDMVALGVTPMMPAPVWQLLLTLSPILQPQELKETRLFMFVM